MRYSIPRAPLKRRTNAASDSAGSPGRSGVARLLVPKIGLDTVVVEGTTAQALLMGPGHMENTAFPGTEGNSVIAAHRDTFFRRLGELRRGDSIYLESSDDLYHYTVTGTRVVEPGDLSVVKPTADALVTLITCYPIRYVGPAPRRLVVVAQLKPTRTNPG